MAKKIAKYSLGDADDIQRELGRHASDLHHHERELDALKAMRDEDLGHVITRLHALEASQKEYIKQTRQTRWTRRGALLAVGTITMTVGWIVRYDPKLAEEIVAWMIRLTSPTR